MRFLRFEIRNFKGIKHAILELSTSGRASVYTLVGLNESGKTTVLEAIHSFSPDNDTEVVVGSAQTADEQRMLSVPKSKISYFTGDVHVEATISLEPADIEAIKSEYREAGLDLDVSTWPSTFTFARIQRYSNGTFVGNFYNCTLPVRVKAKGQRKFRDPAGDEFKIFVPTIALLSKSCGIPLAA